MAGGILQWNRSQPKLVPGKRWVTQILEIHLLLVHLDGSFQKGVTKVYTKYKNSYYLNSVDDFQLRSQQK